MGCILSKVSDYTETETGNGQKTRKNGLSCWVGEKRKVFIRLGRPCRIAPSPHSKFCEEKPNDIPQKPQRHRRQDKKVTQETLDQTCAEKKATRRRRVKKDLSSSKEQVSHPDNSGRKINKPLVRKRTPYKPVDGKCQKEEEYSTDPSHPCKKGECSEDNAPSVCSLDLTREGCEWCEVTRQAERQAVLRRREKYKRTQRADKIEVEDGWDSDKEQMAYLASKEWQEKRKRIETWVEDVIREFFGEEELGEKEDEKLVEKGKMVMRPKMERIIEMEEVPEEQVISRDEIMKAADAKMERFYAARMEMRMQKISERARAEEGRQGKKVLKSCRLRRKDEVETKKSKNVRNREETERKSKGTKDPLNLTSFDFEDCVDDLTRRKVKKTGGIGSRQKGSEKVKGKREHVHPMEELDVAINELLNKNDAKSLARRTNTKQMAVPRNAPAMHGIAPSVASRYQGGSHFPATCSASNTLASRVCPTTQINQMTSQRRRLPRRPNAAYGDRPYPPTTGKIPESAREFFQRQRKY